LRAYVEEAAWVLATDTADGAEVPFELVEEGGRHGAPLYCYRPLVDDFLRDRLGDAGRLDSQPPAVRALAVHDGLASYLRTHGENPPSSPAARAEAALRVLLGATFGESTEFEFDSHRFETAYAQLEDTLYAGKTHAAVVVPVLGLDIASPEIVLGEGLTLTRVDSLPGAPPEVAAESDVVAAYRAEVQEGAADPFAAAGRAFRRLIAALRLYDGGGIALGAVAWTQTDGGAWRAAILGAGGAPEGLTLIEVDQEDELRGFCSLVARRTPRAGELAWALARFGMACERATPQEALSDVLLALRALLEPEGAASGRLAGRLAALCATPEKRPALTQRVAEAVALERAVVSGTAPHGPQVDALIVELTGHLRALLRDLLCGHLETDVRTLADRLISEDQPTAV